MNVVRCFCINACWLQGTDRLHRLVETNRSISSITSIKILNLGKYTDTMISIPSILMPNRLKLITIVFRGIQKLIAIVFRDIRNFHRYIYHNITIIFVYFDKKPVTLMWHEKWDNFLLWFMSYSPSFEDNHALTTSYKWRY